MKKYYSPEVIRRADKTAAEELKLPTIVLMENAARSAAKAAIALAKDAEGLFVIAAGAGNNGGDGFACARRLALLGKRVAVIKTRDDEKYSGDALVNLEVLRTLLNDRLTLRASQELTDCELDALFASSCCIIDALLGTGAAGAPRGEASRLTECMKDKANILAMDIPSGTDGATGAVYEPHITAEATVTFAAPKTGMAFSPARECCGRVITADIGAPAERILSERELELYEKSDLIKFFPPVNQNIHKTNRGSLLIYAGSSAYRGAPLLCARGALRAGAGLVYLAIPDYMVSEAAAVLPEAIFIPLPAQKGTVLPEKAKQLFRELQQRCDAAAVGPGTGLSPENEQLFLWFMREWKKPLVCDADMLTLFAKHSAGIAFRKDLALTPHSGEAARLLGCTAEAVENDRAAAARSLAEKAGAVLLKGPRTLIAAQQSCLRMVDAGCAALAVPGSGDVLTGITGALLAAGETPEEALTGAALVHGAAGELLEKKYGDRGILAREIADEIPLVLREYA